MSNKINRDYYSAPKAGRIMRRLWQIAGGDKYLLERATYTDQIKYMCLGGIILATGVLASLAGGYAFYTIFSPKGDAINKIELVQQKNSVQISIDSIRNLNNPSMKGITDSLCSVQNQIESSLQATPLDVPSVVLSIIFGLIWGLIIFNIDRFIVTSTGKGDGTEAITRSEIIQALPRIVMGLIIALTISKPVEIRMFQSEIDVALYHKQDSVRQVFIAQKDTIRKNKLATLIKEGYSGMILDLESGKARADSLNKQLSEHILGKDGLTAGYGPGAKNLERLLINERQRIKEIELSVEYSEFQREKKNIMTASEMEKIEADKVAAGLDGLKERITILHDIAFWISMFVSLLFVVIELTPIFFKLMLIKTPYDYMEENVKELIKAENGIEVKYDYYLYNPPPEVDSEPRTWFFGLFKRKPKEREGVQQHLVINHEAERKIYETKKATETQQRLIDKALSIYEEEMNSKIEENPEEFIISNSNQIIERPIFSKDEEIERMNIRLEKYRLKRLELKAREDINKDYPLDEDDVKEKPEDKKLNEDDSSKDNNEDGLDKDDPKES